MARVDEVSSKLGQYMLQGWTLLDVYVTAVCYLLSAACCLLPAACCLLSAVCCLLPAVSSHSYSDASSSLYLSPLPSQALFQR
jgi:hypothetical protein